MWLFDLGASWEEGAGGGLSNLRMGGCGPAVCVICVFFLAHGWVVGWARIQAGASIAHRPPPANTASPGRWRGRAHSHLKTEMRSLSFSFIVNRLVRIFMALSGLRAMVMVEAEVEARSAAIADPANDEPCGGWGAIGHGDSRWRVAVVLW